jgi:rod shape-determining protein MreD
MRRALSLLAFLAFAWAAILLELAPISGAAATVAAPDLLFCVAAAFASRPRGGAPALAVFLLGLLRDALAGGALGLGALALVATVEGVRMGAMSARPQSLLLRWSRAALWAAAGAAMVWIGLLIALAPTPPLADVALRVGMTALAYPLVALAVMATGLGRAGAAPETDGPRLRRLA